MKFRIDQSVYRDGSQYFKVDEDTGEIYLTKRLEGLVSVGASAATLIDYLLSLGSPCLHCLAVWESSLLNLHLPTTYAGGSSPATAAAAALLSVLPPAKMALIIWRLCLHGAHRYFGQLV